MTKSRTYFTKEITPQRMNGTIVECNVTFVERIEVQNATHLLECTEEFGLGSRDCELVDLNKRPKPLSPSSYPCCQNCAIIPL